MKNTTGIGSASWIWSAPLHRYSGFCQCTEMLAPKSPLLLPNQSLKWILLKTGSNLLSSSGGSQQRKQREMFVIWLAELQLLFYVCNKKGMYETKIFKEQVNREKSSSDFSCTLRSLFSWSWGNFWRIAFWNRIKWISSRHKKISSRYARYSKFRSHFLRLSQICLFQRTSAKTDGERFQKQVWVTHFKLCI